MNEEAIQLAQYPSGQKPSPDSVPKIERDDFPAPPFQPDRRTNAAAAAAAAPVGKEPQVSGELHQQQQRQPSHAQQRASRPRSREIVLASADEADDNDPQLRKEEEELSKIANGIGKIFLQTLKEREKLRAWKRANLDPRNASRTPSATRELPNKPLRYDNPLNASPSRDLDRPRPWEDEGPIYAPDGGGDHSPPRARSPLGRSQMSTTSSAATYGYKVVQSNRSTPRPGYGLSAPGAARGYDSAMGVDASPGPTDHAAQQYTHSRITGRQQQQQQQLGPPSDVSFVEQQRIAQARSTDLLNASKPNVASSQSSEFGHHLNNGAARNQAANGAAATLHRHLTSSSAGSSLRRSMPNVSLLHMHSEGPPKLYPYHLLATTNYRLPPDVDRCHLERHLSNEEFQYIFHCDRIDFYRMPEWKRNELKRRARLF